MSNGTTSNMGEGFVKVWRSIRDWEWYSDDRVKVLFLHLLVTCNWKEGRWRGEVIPPGSSIISIAKVAAELGWSRSSLNRTLDKLEKSGEVERKTSAKWTLVTLVNWAKYQDDGTKTERKTNARRTEVGQVQERKPDTIEEGKKERREEGILGATSLEDRRSAFAETCKAIVTATPARLPETERRGFFDYWTETSADGKRMRFEDEKYFDHGRRMDTWRKRWERDGGKEDTAPSSTLKEYRL